MSRLTANYHLGRRPRQCAASGEPIRPGERYIAAVVERPEDDDLAWLGFRADAWDPEHPPAGLMAWWNAVAPESDEDAPARLDHGSLLDVFDQLAEADDERRQAFRYILTLVLMRKRLLTHVGVETDPPALLVKRRGAGDTEPDRVLDPGLTPETLTDVTRRVAAILDADDGRSGS